MSGKTLSRDLILLHSTMWIQIQNLWLIWKKLLSISFKCSLLSHTIIQSRGLDKNSFPIVTVSQSQSSNLKSMLKIV